MPDFRQPENLTRNTRILWLALGLAAASVVFRSIHLDWGLPDLEDEALPLKKAFEMCGWGTGQVRLNPDTAGWPSLSFYVHMVVQMLHYLIGRLFGAFADSGDYFIQKATWTPVAIWARAVGVAAAAVVVFIGARIGGRLAGAGGAAIAGTILVASPFLTNHARLITPDILLVMFAALALQTTLDVLDSGRRRSYLWTGIWIGLGISAKYTPILLTPVLFAAHLMRLRTEGRPLKFLGLDDARIWWAGLACVLVFVATSPFVLADLQVLGRDMDYQLSHMQEGHFGHASQIWGPVFYFRDVLAPGLGWPGLILGITGLAFAARRRGGPWWIVLATFAVYFVALSLLKTRFDRYLLPGLLPLALGAAGWWVWWTSLAKAGWRRWSPAVLAMLIAVLVLLPAVRSVKLIALQGRPGTLQQAKEWILQHRDGQGGPYVAMELYTPFLPRTKQIMLRRSDPAFENLSPDQKRRWLDLDPVNVVYLPFYATGPYTNDFYYDLRHFLVYDFVVTSSQVRDRQATKAGDAAQDRFYAMLDAEIPEVTVFAPDEEYRGPEIRIYHVTPEVRAKIAASLPPLSRDEFRAAAPHVAGVHFENFVKTIAEHAAKRGDFATAATYYQALYDALPTGEGLAYLPYYVPALVRVERWDTVAPLLEEWVQAAPGDPRPHGFLGMWHRQAGRVDEARQAFRACLELTADRPQYADLTTWARQQIAGLEDQ